MARRIRITQIRSRSGRQPDLVATLRALGLRRNQQSVVKEETPQVRGMLVKVRHLVRVEDHDRP